MWLYESRRVLISLPSAKSITRLINGITGKITKKFIFKAENAERAKIDKIECTEHMEPMKVDIGKANLVV